MSRFVADAVERAQLPVAILGGFLGSGKTTLLNALLRHPAMAGTAVAINEFGEVPIDQHLVEADSGAGPDRTVTMANGCLCCDLSGDLEGAVMRIFARRESGALPRFDRMLVEPSGLADPAPIAQALLRNPVLSRVLRLDAILATVDAAFGAGQLARHPEARAQVALADRLLLTKTDLADPAPLRAALSRLNPLAPVADIRHGAAEPAALFPARFLGTPGAPPPVVEWLDAQPHGPAPAHDHAHAHSKGACALSLVSDAPPDWAVFDAWFRRVRIEGGERLLRAKGLIGVPGQPGPVVVQGVQHVLHPPVALPAWPAGDRRSRLVLITDGLPHAPLRAGWDALFHAA
ncbi:GTP-binding protein [Roseomonas nepalensis]|uniref:GTP-binding protein n=1 Tax=Muricoccus nepalensis TaxID=1854500 RepID=A0A502FCW0_9PROT|nr:GTP-binding protein [Roseomonas nepalensis]TPG47230.1 GTP-binding protein [Roseomonas nepalensis]